MAISAITPPPVDNGQAAPKADQIRPESQKLELNASVVQATISFSAEKQPMELLYKSAVEKLNEMLEPELGANAIQNTLDQQIDFSPEATAERIVSFATSFFGNYLENHPEQGGEEALKGFTSIIRDAIDKGFQEAKDVLEGLQVLEGDIAANIDKTYELVQEGLNRFEEQQTEQLVANP